MYLKKAKKLIVSGVFLLVGGCYTQFGSLNQSNQDTGSVPDTSIVVDSTGDTVKVVHKTDTVLQKEHEICVWERDLLGYPRLNCYKTYYPRNWFIYNNTPWWYRNDAFWDDYGRCPRYHYYDPSCGCCRYSNNWRDYYTHDYDRYDNHHGGGYNHHDGGSSNNNGSSNSGGVSPVTKPSSPADLKDSRTSGKRIKVPSTPAQSQPPEPQGVQKSVTETPPTPQIQQGPTHTGNADTMQVRRRDIRSLRSR